MQFCPLALVHACMHAFVPLHVAMPHARIHRTFLGCLFCTHGCTLAIEGGVCASLLPLPTKRLDCNFHTSIYEP